VLGNILHTSHHLRAEVCSNKQFIIYLVQTRFCNRAIPEEVLDQVFWIINAITTIPNISLSLLKALTEILAFGIANDMLHNL